MTNSKGLRLKSMIKLDFYRLFHTPLFYIMLLIAALIPALILTTSGMENPTAVEPTTTAVENINIVETTTTAIEYKNTWQLIESTGESAVAENPMDFGGYANINMVFIFAGILISIFVAHDYSSGFVKNIFTVHAKKKDYVISKTLIGIFGGIGMILTYLLGTIVSGLLVGTSFDVNVMGLILCLISKMFLMGIFCSLFLGISVFFKNKLWLTIIFTFLFGMIFYPAASVATLNSNIMTTFITLVAGMIGALIIGTISKYILNHRDLV